MSESEITVLKVSMARIEEMLRAHFARDDERSKRLDSHEDRINALEAAEDQRKGGKAMLAALISAAALVGGIVANLITGALK